MPGYHFLQQISTQTPPVTLHLLPPHTHIHTHTLLPHNACQEDFFLILWCMPSLHPIITPDCNRHLCSQSSFYFLAEKENCFAADTFYASHTRRLPVSSTLAAGLARPDCSRSTFTAREGFQRCQNAVRTFKGRPCVVYCLFQDG